MMLSKIFANFGMSDREAKLYLACLRLSKPTVADLQKNTRLSRSTVYYCLELLIKNGIIFSKKINNQIIYEPITLEELKKKLDYKINELKSDLVHFNKIIPDLNKIAKKGKLNLKMVEGMESYLKILNEQYSAHQNSIVKVFGTKPSEHNHGFFKKKFKNFLNNRIENNVFLKGISPLSENKILVRNKDTEQLREGRFLPEDKFDFESEIFIFNDLVLVVSEDIENGIFVVFFDDQSYVKTMNMIFDLAWEAAEKYDREVVMEYQANNMSL